MAAFTQVRCNNIHDYNDAVFIIPFYFACSDQDQACKVILCASA